MRLLVARGLAIVHMYSVYPHYKPLDTTRVIRRTITFLKTRWVAINSVQSAINDVRSWPRNEICLVIASLGTRGRRWAWNVNHIHGRGKTRGAYISPALLQPSVSYGSRSKISKKGVWNVFMHCRIEWAESGHMCWSIGTVSLPWCCITLKTDTSTDQKRKNENGVPEEGKPNSNHICKPTVWSIIGWSGLYKKPKNRNHRICPFNGL